MTAAIHALDRLSPTARAPYLGPGQVVEFDGPRVVCELRDQSRVSAELAMPIAYQPCVGDVLLVITQETDEAYVIGVLSGQGRSKIELAGDVDVRAVGGKLRLSGDNGVSVEGPELDVVVDRYKLAAQSVVQRCATLYQRARELFTLEARDAHQLVERDFVARSNSATLVAEEKVVVNGNQVHLG
ncbi:MAG: DUF3540 domain-containing protein [Polyangiaceae bacterium]